MKRINAQQTEAEPSDPIPGCGILYSATGRSYLDEALVSARQVARWMPGYPIDIWTDAESAGVASASGMFRRVNVFERQAEVGHAEKISPMWESPFEKTLFLDTDTYMCRDCSEIFRMLDRYHVAVAHDPWRSEYTFEGELDVPLVWPTFNTGVIGFRSTSAVKAFLHQWHSAYIERFRGLQEGSVQDQPAFRYTLYHSGLQVYVLPPEYNLRIYHPVCIGGHVGPAILHDRNPHLSWLADELSAGRRPRVFGMQDPRLLFCYWVQKIHNVAARCFGSESRQNRRSGPPSGPEVE